MTARKARKHPGITQTASSTPPSAYRNQRAPAPLSVIPEGNLLLLLPLPLPLLFCLSFPKGICCCIRSCRCPCLSVCHSRRESAVAFAIAVAFAFLSVIPKGNLLLPRSPANAILPPTSTPTQARDSPKCSEFEEQGRNSGIMKRAAERACPDRRLRRALYPGPNSPQFEE